MKKNNQEINRWRIRHGLYGTTNRSGNTGAFRILRPGQPTLFALASDGLGWDHVSVSVFDQQRCPTWEEMCYVKDLFFEPNEMCVQYHPAECDYVRCHPYVLHIWRPHEAAIPKPPTEMVGPLS